MNSSSVSFLPALLLLAAGCGRIAAQDAASTVDPAAPVATQRELLQLANAAFVPMPLVPHAKNRAKGQAAVVEAALELGDVAYAALVADTIPDWRRGLAHAQCALYFAKAGEREAAQRHVAVAETVARAVAGDPNEQAWRAARIVATLARVQLVWKDDAGFARYSQQLEAADAAGIQRDVALSMAEDAFPAWLERADAEFAGSNFDSILATLQTCTQLFERFFGDVERREALQKRVLEAYPKLPRDARVSMILDLATTAARRGDGVRALELAHEAQRIVAAVKYHAEDEVFLKARIAGVVHRAGDTAEGKKLLDGAQQLYDENVAKIVDIYRSAALRSIAEACHEAGLEARALEVYARAVEAGLANPNSRPRADDVAAVCLSMAKRGLAPDEGLTRRLRAVVEGLGNPW